MWPLVNCSSRSFAVPVRNQSDLRWSSARTWLCNWKITNRSSKHWNSSIQAFDEFRQHWTASADIVFKPTDPHFSRTDHERGTWERKQFKPLKLHYTYKHICLGHNKVSSERYFLNFDFNLGVAEICVYGNQNRNLLKFHNAKIGQFCRFMWCS